jgi:hypothetical protein
MVSVSAGGPDADRAQDRRIVFWHARAHDKLDTYGVPRFDGNMELMLEERIARLAENGPSDPPPRDNPHPDPPLRGRSDA